jgi:hypothetical protein
MNRRGAIKATVAAAVSAALWSQGVLARRGYGAVVAFEFNPMGTNLAAGGSGTLYFEGMPFFKNQVRQARGFQQVGNNTVWVPRSTAGWPTTDFDLHLYASSICPAWAPGVWSCGFIGSGAEAITALGTGVTVGSIVHGTGGAYTTFQLTVPSGCLAFGYSVGGTTGGVTNVFAYMPEYNTLNTIDDVTNVNSLRSEFVTHIKQFSHMRSVIPGNNWFNTRLSTSANRNTPSNTQSNNDWSSPINLTFTAIPGTGDTGATLAAPFTDLTGSYGIRIAGTTVQWRIATLTNGATTCDWTSGGGALTSAGNSATTFYATEGYPVEWIVTMANAANIGLYLNTPIFEDGANGSAGTWLTSVCDYIATHYTGPGPVIFEIPGGNENWNGSGNSNHIIQLQWQLYGFSSLFDYYAYRLHQSATLIKSRFPVGWWNTKVFTMFAYQAAVVSSFTSILSGYSTYGTPSVDLGYMGGAPYSNPPIANTTDSVATILADAFSDAQNLARGSNAPAMEQITVTGLHYGIPHMTYETGFQWNGNVKSSGIPYSSFVNVGAAILDPGYTPCLEALHTSVLNSGVVLITHFQDGVSTSTANNAPVCELSTDEPTVESSPAMVALKTFLPPNVFTPTRNDVTTPGTVIDGRNYTDNITTAATFPNLGGGGFANPSQAPYGGTAGKGTVAYLLYSKVSRTVSLSANFTGAGSTHLEWGSAPAGFSVLGGVDTPTSITIPAGTNNVAIGSFPVVKGWNYVLLGVPGTVQAGVQINSLTAG